MHAPCAMLFHASANATFWVAMTAVRHTPRERIFVPLYLAMLGIAAAVCLVSLRGRGFLHRVRAAD